MRPLDVLSSIKMKLGIVIVAAVGVVVLVHPLGVGRSFRSSWWGWWPEIRSSAWFRSWPGG